MKLLIQKAILANILLFIGYSLSAGEIKIKIDSITRMIPKTKFIQPQHLCAYLHVSSFILDIVVRYPELPCRSLGGLSFHVYPNIIIDNGTKSEHADKNINITEISSQLLINLL